MRHNRDELSKLPVEELVDKCAEQDAYIESLLSKIASRGDEGGTSRETDDKLKQQQQEAARRENVLYMKLTTKEQELQDCMKQIQELQQAQTPTAERLRAMLLDPAVSLLFRRMKKEVESLREKLDQAQNDLAASKFTPDSQTGKRLMAKCRMLLQENEELGKVISTGRTARLEGEIALQKKLAQEMKKTQTDTEEFLSELDEEVEGMQSAIYLLQQQLREAHERTTQLEIENSQLKSSFADLTAKLGGAASANDTAVTNSNHLAGSVNVSSGHGSVATATSLGSQQPAAILQTVPAVVYSTKPQDLSSVAKDAAVASLFAAVNSNERTSHSQSEAASSVDGLADSRTKLADYTLSATSTGRVVRDDESNKGSKCDEHNGETHGRTKDAIDSLPNSKLGLEVGVSFYRTGEGAGHLLEGEYRTKDGKQTSSGDNGNFTDSKSEALFDNLQRNKLANDCDNMEVAVRKDYDKSVDNSQPKEHDEMLTPKSEEKHSKSNDSGITDKKHGRTKEELMDASSPAADELNDHVRAKSDATDSPHRAHRTKRAKKEKDSPEPELQYKRRKLARTGSKGGEDMPNGLGDLSE